jgi:CheY-specific phosphatase CheX
MPIDMQKRIQTAFDYATMYTFRKMIMLELSPISGGHYAVRPGDYLGTIILSGDIAGHCTLCLSEEIARTAITRLTGETMEGIDGICDGVGEFANMIAGNAKATLQEFHVSLSMPKVVCFNGGEDVPSMSPRSIQLTYTSEIGNIGICIDLTCSQQSDSNG